MTDTFLSLGLNEDFLGRLQKIGITSPTPVQKAVVPEILSGQNVIFQSETGTGKTFAFLLPLLQNIEPQANPTRAVRIVIVSPTFELASQLRQAASSVTGLKTALFIGGAPLKRQIESLKERPAIVVGTPARLLELARLKKLKFSECSALVLDEADRLFSKEIKEETSQLAGLFEKAQVIACSATVSGKTRAAVEEAAKKQEAFKVVLLPREEVIGTKISHWAFFAERREKIDFLRSLLNILKDQKVLVFTSRADQVQNISEKLKFKKINCEALHSHTKNQERQSILSHFKSGKTKVLVTSDLSSRGLDIPKIDYVVQMDLPSDEDFFIHRSGRTARAGKTGVNIVIGDEYELRALAALEKKLKIKVFPKMLYKGKITSPQQDA